MTKQEIKDRIVQIINNAGDYITADQIYSRLTREVDPGRTQETIRRHIRELVNEQDNLIGSSQNGFFRINTLERAIEAINYIESRIPDLQTRANNIRRIWNESNPGNPI